MLRVLPCRYTEGDRDATVGRADPPAGNALGTAKQTTGVDPLSWIPNPFGRRNPPCHEHVPHTRLSFATRWWS